MYMYLHIVGDGQIPLSELFQKSSDVWECQVCMITNKNAATTCAACSSPKPNFVNNAPTVCKFCDIFSYFVKECRSQSVVVLTPSYLFSP